MNVLPSFLLSGWGERIGWALIHSVWQVAIVAAVYGVATFALRRRSANVRYLLGCAALLAMVAAPAVTFVRLPHSSPNYTAAPLLRSVMEPTQDITWLDQAPLETMAPSSVDAETQIADSPPAAEPSPASLSVSKLLEFWRYRLEPALPWLSSAWLLGVVLLAMRPLVGLITVSRLKHRGLAPLSTELRELAGRLLVRLGVQRAVQFAESALVQVPTVVGYLRPMVLLPASAVTGLTTEQLELILAHELAHVRRHDYLVNLLQTVVEALLFFHPGMWWVSSQVRRERENCCDDVAVEACGDRASYIRALWMIEARRTVSSPALAATGGSLLDRVRRLVFGRQRTSRSERTTAWLAGLVVLGIVALLLLLGQSMAGQTPSATTDQAAAATEELSTDEELSELKDSEETSEEATDVAEESVEIVENSNDQGQEKGEYIEFEAFTPLPTLDSAPDETLLRQEIDKALDEVRRYGEGHVIVGRVLVEGKDDPTHVNAQMEILGGGYFAGTTRDLERPVGFRMHGYAQYDLQLSGRRGRVVDVGTIQLKRLSEEELAPLAGRIELEDGGDLSTVSVQVSITEGPVNTPGGGTSGRRDWPDPLQMKLDSAGRFYETGFSPTEYQVYVTAPGFVKQYRKVELRSDRITDLGTIVLERPRRVELEFLTTRQPPFPDEQPQQAILEGGGRWQITPHKYRYDLEFAQKQGRLAFRWSYGPIFLADLGPGRLTDYLHITGGTAAKPPNLVPLVDGHVYLVRRPEWVAGGEHFALFKLRTDAEANRDTALTPEPRQTTGELRRDTRSDGRVPGDVGRLTGRILYAGPPPEPKPLQIPLTNRYWNGEHWVETVELSDRRRVKELGLVDESLVVGQDGGLANVVIWARSEDMPFVWQGGPLLPSTIRAQDGRFQPHVLAFWQAAPLKWVNGMDGAVDFRWQGRFNQRNGTVGGDQKYEFRLNKPEPVPNRLASSTHPWMRAYILPLAHPYFAVTDRDGRFEIKNLPLGEWEFAMWHERTGWLETDRFPTGRFTWTIRPGDNSLGDLRVDPQTLVEKAAEEPVVAEPPSVDRLDEEGFSQLHRAATGGHAARVTMLLAQGANVNVEQGTYHGTPLQYAAHNGHGETVQVLLEHGADVNARDANGRTPLVWAAMKGHADVIGRLLDAGADVNTANAGGWTALHYAVVRGHEETAQLLIDRGADVHAANSQGKTPVDLNPELNLRIPWRALRRSDTSDRSDNSSRSPPRPTSSPPASDSSHGDGRGSGLLHAPTDVVALVRGKPIRWRDIEPSPKWFEKRAEYERKHGNTLGYESPQDYPLNRLRELIWTPLIDEYKEEHDLKPTEAEIDEFIRRFREVKTRRQQETAADLEQRKQRLAQIRMRLDSADLPLQVRRMLEQELAVQEGLIAVQEKFAAAPRPEMDAAGERFFAQWYLGNWKLQQSLYKQYGGRAIWQQVGPEAIDAMRELLKEKKAQGFFVIHDPSLRQRFWEYFVNDQMHVFIPDPDHVFSHPWSSFEQMPHKTPRP